MPFQMFRNSKVKSRHSQKPCLIGLADEGDAYNETSFMVKLQDEQVPSGLRFQQIQMFTSH